MIKSLYIIGLLTAMLAGNVYGNTKATEMKTQKDCSNLLDFSAQKLRSKEVLDFCEKYEGQALLIVNTASRCGFTKQFKGLEELNKRDGSQGLSIVGFPSDDFRQEYDDAEETAKVCYVNYGVTFDMVETSSVKGETANKLFQRLAAATGKEPSWNFNKYLISPMGDVSHFGSMSKPLDGNLEKEIKKVLP